MGRSLARRPDDPQERIWLETGPAHESSIHVRLGHQPGGILRFHAAAILDDESVRDRAPEAKLLVVGYLRLMPSNRTCTAIPFSRGDVAWFAAIEKTLSDSLLRAARSRDLPVVDMRSASDDHDVCAGSRAWVNGPRPKDGDGILYHPNGAGERAVARAVVRALRS